MATLDFSSFTNQKKPASLGFFGDLFCNSEVALESIVNGDPLQYLSGWMKTIDFCVGGLETPITGKTEGFPNFSANEIFAKYLSGKFDLLFTANNHSLDQGLDGVVKTLDILDSYGINYIGTSKPNKKRNEFSVTVNGHDISFLNYTTSVNGQKTPTGILAVDVPSDESTRKLINFYDETEVEEALNLAKKKSEIVIIEVHRRVEGEFDENRSRPDEQRVKDTNRLVNMGADLAISAHPHLFQGGKIFDGGRCAVYSLGDFFNDKPRAKNMSCVAVMRIDSFENIQYTFLPTATINTEKGLLILPLAPLVEGAYNFIDSETLAYYAKELDDIRNIMIKNSLTEETIPVYLL